MLDTIQKGSEETQQFPPQVCAQGRISSVMVKEQWGDVETIETKLVLEWLGHLARIQAHRLPSICLFELDGDLRPDHVDAQEGDGEPTW